MPARSSRSALRRVAIVTGASRGIGRACVSRLLEEGYSVVLSSRAESDLMQVVEECGAAHAEALCPLAIDLSDLGAGTRLVSKAIEAYGRLDLVVANAGMYSFAPLEQLELERWNEVIQINLTSVLRLIQASLPELQRQAGYFIAIGSVSGMRGFSGEAAYGASKRALRILTDIVYAEHRHHGVRASVIAPGVVRTRMAAYAFSRPDYGPGGDADGLLNPLDVAETVVWLTRLSPAAVVPEVVLGDSRMDDDPLART